MGACSSRPETTRIRMPIRTDMLPIDVRPDGLPGMPRSRLRTPAAGSGKILRSSRRPKVATKCPTESVPEDGSKGLPEIYVMGCRNPWRHVGRSGDRDRFTGARSVPMRAETETAARAVTTRSIRPAQLGNFGWPYFIADNKPYHDVDYTTGQVGPLFDVMDRSTSPQTIRVRNSSGASACVHLLPRRRIEGVPGTGRGGRTACAGRSTISILL